MERIHVARLDSAPEGDDSSEHFFAVLTDKESVEEASAAADDTAKSNGGRVISLHDGASFLRVVRHNMLDGL